MDTSTDYVQLYESMVEAVIRLTAEAKHLTIDTVANEAVAKHVDAVKELQRWSPSSSKTVCLYKEDLVSFGSAFIVWVLADHFIVNGDQETVQELREDVRRAVSDSISRQALSHPLSDGPRFMLTIPKLPLTSNMEALLRHQGQPPPDVGPSNVGGSMKTIQFGKLVQRTFSSEDGQFNLYRLHCTGGKWSSAVYIGDKPPKALKTVEYQLHGNWNTHPRYGRQFVIDSHQRADKDPHKTERSILNRSIKTIEQGRFK